MCIFKESIKKNRRGKSNLLLARCRQISAIVERRLANQERKRGREKEKEKGVRETRDGEIDW